MANDTYIDVMLTTVDNPYNPFEDFDKWINYDMVHGYNSCGIVARLAPGVDEYNEEFDVDARCDAIMRFVREDPLKHYTFVTKEIERYTPAA